ncbi:hypothetical protein PA25_36050 [Pseudoalteromonas sp. A25]|uniref:PKD domain-containing protein n=1 Tax=Pseudoalteromonas sp. A25 TaxID=116092 RepID=UPI001260C946|nr:hypothetical protein [Pseudoalteromonas sp. A25]BBN83620.1 hypothetical protein PA25_36050 [Pseudoalteromonas sp. A25]
MKPVNISKGLALSVLTLALTACGGGSSDTPATPDSNEVTTPVTPPVTPTEPENQAPVIEAASALQVQERAQFSFTAQASDADGEVTSYSWEQTAGTGIELSSLDSDTIEFLAPEITEDQNITLTLTVTDDKEATTSQEFNISLKAYGQPSSDSITDSALLSCIQNAELDFGATNIECNGTQVAQLTGLELFTKLTSLSVEGGKLQSIETLSSLTQLERLRLKDNAITDFAAANSLVNLTELSLSADSSNTLSNLDFTNFLNLKSLGVFGLENSSHIQFDLSTLPVNLTALSLHQVSNVYSSDLSAFTQLEKLSLKLKNNIESLSFLTKMPNIQELEIELRDSYNSFSDPSAFAVTPNLTKLSLVYSNISDYSFIGDLTQLKQLNITNGYRYNARPLDASSMSSLTSLESLKLNGVKLENHGKLSQHSALKELQLSYNLINSVGFLESMSELTSLEISNNDIIDMGWLKFAPKLEHLSLKNLSTDAQFSTVSSLPQLKSLHIEYDSYYNTSFDVKDLEQLSNLETLRLDIQTITNIDKLQSLSKLKSLDLEQSGLSLLPNISNLKELESLTLINNYSSDTAPEDLTGLGTSASLKHLTLKGFRKVSDFSALESYTQLTELKLSNFDASDITPISTLTGLKTLVISNFNELIYVNSLSNLVNLQSLDLSSNNFLYCTDVETLKTTFADIDSSEFPYNCIDKPIDYSVLVDENLRNYFRSNNYKDASKVNYLTIEMSEVSSLAGIEQFENLQGLTFRHLTDLSVIDSATLSQLPNLNKIRFDYNRFTTLESLSLPSTVTELHIEDHNVTLSLKNFNAPSLTKLSLRWLTLSDTESLSGFTNLTSLDLYRANITDLTPIFTLTNLQQLDLRDNSNIGCDQLAQLKAKLTNTNIYSPYQCR